MQMQDDPLVASQPQSPPKKPSQRRHRGPFIGTIDKYLIKTFLGTYVFSILLILSVSIVFDVNEKMDDFLSPQVTLYEIVFHYYLNFIPYYANMFSPLFVFISAIYFTSKKAENTEIVAMLASGMSFTRLLRPYMLSALLISAVTFVFNNFIIPPSNKVRLEFHNKYIRNKTVEYAESIQAEVEDNVFIYIQSFNNRSKQGENFSLDKFEGKELRSRLTAREATFDSISKRWHLTNFRLRTFGKYREIDSVGNSLDTIVAISPADLVVSEGDVETMTTPKLSEYIARQKDRGVGNAKLFEIEIHKRYAAVFSAFILTFIGAVLSSKKVKNGLGINIAIGLGLSFSYILLMTVTSTFAVSGSMPPWLAAWLPNFLFVFIALMLWPKNPGYVPHDRWSRLFSSAKQPKRPKPKPDTEA